MTESLSKMPEAFHPVFENVGGSMQPYRQKRKNIIVFSQQNYGFLLQVIQICCRICLLACMFKNSAFLLFLFYEANL
ncbi:hypothetical protein D7Y09_07820 [bacterium 1XD42-1]|nr:hypothetical protein D7X25_06090 [bacterium 1XD42-8]RKJ64775.1 hypothetical protein D7Y09_07820 [bacterium 1XD42-1]